MQCVGGMVIYVSAANREALDIFGQDICAPIKCLLLFCFFCKDAAKSGPKMEIVLQVPIWYKSSQTVSAEMPER